MFVEFLRAGVQDDAAARSALQRWTTAVRGAPGFLGATWGVSSAGEVVVLARHQDEEAARVVEESAGVTATWEAVLALLVEPVTRIASSSVDVSMGGGSDDAGFVQVFWGRGDRAGANAVMAEAESILREERPDIIGGITVWLDDGRFVDVAYFRSEAEARAGEATELSDRGRAVFARFAEVLPAEGYVDLPEPHLV